MLNPALKTLLDSRHIYRPQARTAAPACWNLSQLRGRMLELSGEAIQSVAMGLVIEAQAANQPTAWVCGAEATYFPPDADLGGVDLAALVTVLCRTERRRLRAADILLRSGAFGLVVLDLDRMRGMPLPAQTRLAGLAQRHDATLVCLTRKQASASSLGSLISLHGWTSIQRQPGGGFSCAMDVLKDKRRGPGWQHQETFRGPPGLR